MSIEIKDKKLKKALDNFQGVLYNDVFGYLSRVKELYKKEIALQVINEYKRVTEEFITQLNNLLSWC